MASDAEVQHEAAVEAPSLAPATQTGGAPIGLGARGPGPAAVLALQRSAGNAAVSDLMRARGSGSALPPGAAAAASLLGPVAGEVRVHTGDEADARLAGRPGALAVTEGTDIHLARTAPPLESPAGRLLLAHEAAHVLQQRAPGPAADVAHSEAEADAAATAATLGESASVRAAFRGPQFFEAPKHAATLKTAMDQAGFTDQEQQAAYFGNWCRDLSQALVPFLDEKIGHNATFQVVNMLAIRHFGHGVTPSQLGAYSPREHIDNPAGTTDKDVLDAPRRKIEGYPDTADPITGKPQNVAEVAGQEQLEPGNIEAAFKVSSAGVPAYIDRSKQYILEEFDLAVKEGRTAAGLYHLGNFTHTCEDLFAHSNWVEAAVGRLIGEGQIKIPNEIKKQIDERMAAGKPPVEDYAAQAVDKAGNTRPILSTGTFTGGSAGLGDTTGHDTIVSLVEELKNLIEELDPFKPESEGASNWDFVMEILTHMDAAADEGTLGAIVAGVLDPLAEEVEKLADKATEGVDALEGQARDTFGEGRMGDLAAGAAGLLSQGVHAVADPVKEGGKEAVKAVIKTVVDAIGKTGISLAQMAVWVQKGEAWVAEHWKALKDGVRELPAALRELILPKLVEAERNFKKEVQKLGSSLYDKATRGLLANITPTKKETKVEATNVQAKFESWAKALSAFMKDKLTTVGGQSGADLAKAIPAGNDEAEIKALILYAEQTFPGVLRSLMKAADEDAIAEILAATGKQSHQLKQLANVPEWARAGASHSQTAKDHATSPFFGIAFKVANEADKKLVGALKAAWEQAGFTGPAAGLEGNFGEKDASGKQVFDKPDDPMQEARPALKGEEGLSEWEKEARKKFLENRVEGEETVAEGLAPDQSIGKALTGMADRLVKIVQAYPFLGPAFDELIAAIRADPANTEIVAKLDTAAARFDEYAKSGRLDDAVMDEVDTLIARARWLAVSAERRKKEKHSEHEGHEDHGDHKDHEDHDEHAGLEGGDVHTAEQIALLDKYRGVTNWRTHKAKRDEKGKLVGVAVGGLDAAGNPIGTLNQAVKVGQKAPADVRAEAAKDPRERFRAEVDRIFGHPYDSNWWVPTVQDWAEKHQHVLADYIRDRNAGHQHVH